MACFLWNPQHTCISRKAICSIRPQRVLGALPPTNMMSLEVETATSPLHIVVGLTFSAGAQVVGTVATPTIVRGIPTTAMEACMVLLETII